MSGRRVAWILGIVGVAWLAMPAAGTTYYVRVTGNDASVGTSKATAWKTIDKAANTLKAGDTVYVGAGTYTEAITPNNDGTAAKPVKYIADTAGTYTGDAGKVTIQAPANKRALNVDTDDYARFIGFDLVGSTGYDVVRWHTCVGGLLQNCTITKGPKDGVDVSSDAAITLDNCTIDDMVLSGVHLTGAGSAATISNCTISNAGTDGVQVGTGTLLTVTNTTIHDTGDDGIGINGNVTATITGCTVYNAADCGVVVDNSTPTVMLAQLTIHDCLDGIRIRDNATLTAVNCLVYATSDEGVEIENHAGISATFWHLTICGTATNAFYIKGGTASLRNCIIAKNSGRGIYKTGGTLTHTYNDFYSNAVGDFSGTSQSTGEILTDPMFVSAVDFQLQNTSPAINTGTSGSGVTSVDLLGGVRPYGAGWDMGCYEYGSALPAKPKIVSWTQVSP